MLYFGQVTQVIRDEAGTVTRLVLSSERYGEYIMNISSDTVWIDSGNRTASDPADLKEGRASMCSTAPFPPAPFRPSPQPMRWSEYPSGYLLRPVPCGGGDHRGEDGGLIVTTDNGGLLIYLDGDTQTVRYAGGSAALEDLKAGDRIMAWYQAVALSYPGQTHADGLMLLPSEKEEPSSVLPENGTALDLVLEGDMVLPVTGLVENGTAMVPVAAVAQALGYQVIYTPGEDGESDRIAVESDQFSVQMTVGEDQIIGVTKIRGSGDDRPCGLWDGPYIAAPAPPGLLPGSLRCWAAQSPLEGDALSIR